MLATDHFLTETAQPRHPASHLASVPAATEDLTHSLPAGKLRIVGAKEHVYREGDPATHVYRVDAGHVCIYRARRPPSDR
jgi:CRP-like cAMP-binding protein